MILTEQTFTQAMLLAGELEPKREALLKTLCKGAVTSLTAQMRNDVDMEACREDLVAAASLVAIAALNETGEDGRIQQFTAGDVTIRTENADGAPDSLRRQAKWIMAPYLKDSFSFLEV